jgi:hypothetical protein
MSKKSPKYMMLSGWLPVCYSHYRHLESQCVGSNALTVDQFYGILVNIAANLDDNKNKKTILKNIEKYLNDTQMKNRVDAKCYIIEESFNFVSEYYEIYLYYYQLNNDTVSF